MGTIILRDTGRICHPLERLGVGMRSVLNPMVLIVIALTPREEMVAGATGK